MVDEMISQKRALILLKDFNTARGIYPMIANDSEIKLIKKRLRDMHSRCCWYDALASFAYPDFFQGSINNVA